MQLQSTLTCPKCGAALPFKASGHLLNVWQAATQVALRNIPAVQFVFAKFAALLRGNKGRGEPLISEFLDEAPGVTRNAVDQHAAVLEPPSSHEIAAPETNDQSEREKLIRRRWSETGIKMWNPDFHGAGHAALNILFKDEASCCRRSPARRCPDMTRSNSKWFGRTSTDKS